MQKIVNINEHVAHCIYVANPPTPKLSIEDELYGLLEQYNIAAKGKSMLHIQRCIDLSKLIDALDKKRLKKAPCQVERDQHAAFADLPLETMINYLIETGNIDEFKSVVLTATDGETQVDYDIKASRAKRIHAYLINNVKADILWERLHQLLNERNGEAWEASNRGQGI